MAKASGSDRNERARLTRRRSAFWLAPTEELPQVDEDEPTWTCPDCNHSFAERERTHHLLTRHGYQNVFGVLLPLPAALAALWERVFAHADEDAHTRLCQILATLPSPDPTRTSYAVALERELTARVQSVFGSQGQELPRLLRLLRRSPEARSQALHLVRSAHANVRKLGRDILLHVAAEELIGDNASPQDVRRWLDRISPQGDVWDKIQLCQRLARRGVPQAVLADCLQQLRAECPVACPECGDPIPQSQLDDHLRRNHGIYQFRGVRLTRSKMVVALLSAVCRPEPDVAAWEALTALADDEVGSRAVEFLAARLGQRLAGLPQEEQTAAVVGAAEVIASSPLAEPLTRRLARLRPAAARHLALALAARLPAPLEDRTVTAVRRLLSDRRQPGEARVAATAALLATTGLVGAAARQVLEGLVGRSGKKRSIERLRLVEELAGKSPEIETLCQQLELQIRMRCPRCHVQLRRPEMARHVWETHGLLLYGRRVRQPWQVVQDWIEEYRATGKPEVLERVRLLGQRLDPDTGLRRVHRLVLAAGIDLPEVRSALLEEARDTGRSLCPHCYTLLDVPRPIAPLDLSVAWGCIVGGGCLVQVSERGLVPHLTVTFRGETIHRGREPWQWWTFKAALVFLVSPWVVLAVLVAFLAPIANYQPLPLVLLLLTVGAAIAALASLVLQLRPTTMDRAFHYAWAQLVPRLHAEGFSREDSAWVAGLAAVSMGWGKPAARAEPLGMVLSLTEKAAAADPTLAGHLALLRRLALADAAAEGRDLVRHVAAQVGRCFEGELPLSFAELLLADWVSSEWTTGNLARLRVLLCDRAFEAGLEVGDLQEAGRLAPSFGAVVGLDDPDQLCRLRLLWSLRPQRPWDRFSSGSTVFEIAADPDRGRRLLTQHPDLLLADDLGLPVRVCGNGVIVDGKRFTSRPRAVEVRARRDFERVEFELQIGDFRWRFATDPTGLAVRLERWFRFFFEDFEPEVAGVADWKGPGQLLRLRLREAVRCPECQRRVLPRPAAVAQRLTAQQD